MAQVMSTDFSHYSLIADGELLPEDIDSGTGSGPAIMSVKLWASDTDEAADIFIAIANRMNFKIADRLEIFETEPDRAPEDKPYAYDLDFSPYSEDDGDGPDDTGAA